jgi:hypothetical protein
MRIVVKSFGAEQVDGVRGKEIVVQYDVEPGRP